MVLRLSLRKKQKLRRAYFKDKAARKAKMDKEKKQKKIANNKINYFTEVKWSFFKKPLEIETKAYAATFSTAFASLVSATNAKDLHAVKRLLRMGESSLITDSGRSYQQELDSAVSIAVSSHQHQIATLLLENGANVNADEHFYPILLTAIDHCDDKMVLILLNYGADPNVKVTGRTAMHAAALHGNHELIGFLAKMGVAVDDVQDFLSMTPLLLAAQNGHTKAALKLLELGADVTSQDGHGRTAMHHAASTRSPELAKALLDAGASPYVQDKHSVTPWITAIKGRCKEMADLFTAMIDPLYVDAKGRTLLHYVSLAGDLTHVSTLLLRGTDVNLADENGNTALMLALQTTRKFRSLVEKLIEITSAESLRRENSHGQTAMFLALTNKWSSQTIHLLEARGLSVNDKLSCGQSALTRYIILCQPDKSRLDDLLRKHGGDLNSVDANGESILSHLAGKYSDNDWNDVMKYNMDVCYRGEATFTNPLVVALKMGQECKVKDLLSRGCSTSQVLTFLDNKENAEMAQMNFGDETLKLLSHTAQNPKSLAESARAETLRSLGHCDLYDKVSQLQIPIILKYYLEKQALHEVEVQ